MNNTSLTLVELFFFFGAAVAWGLYELRKLKLEERRDAAEQSKDVGKRPPEEP